MNPMTIKIEIRGLALCYYKERQWRAILPFDKDHRVKFCYKKNGSQQSRPVELAGKKTITIKTKSSNLPQVQSRPSFEKFLDVTEKYAHSSGIKFLDPDYVKSVFITFPGVVFSSKTESEMDFLIYKPGATYAVDLGKVGVFSEAEISLEAGDYLIVEPEGEEPKKFDYEAGAIYELCFNNDCPPDNEPEDDFKIYYEIIEDARARDLKLQVIAKIPRRGEGADPKIFEEPSSEPGCTTCVCANITASQTENLP